MHENQAKETLTLAAAVGTGKRIVSLLYHEVEWHNLISEKLCAFGGIIASGARGAGAGPGRA